MRPPRGVEPQSPGPGQESVWDYPRPPLLQRSSKRVVVRSGDVVIAQTTQAWRVLETSHPPTWYLPPDSVTEGALTLSSHPSTTCEWKGTATYWDVAYRPGRLEGRWLEAAAWSYQHPTKGFREITGHLAFLAAADPDAGLTCEVDGELVRPQPGGFYGGWITDDVVGPFKGVPGSWGW